MNDTPYLKIKEIKPETDLSALTPAEKAEFENLKTPKRKAEWLASRLAAKTLAGERFGLPPESFAVVGDRDRRPMMTRVGGTEGEKFHISLSHGGGLCACAMNADLGPLIGVDVEKVEKRAEAWKKDYFTQAEFEYCAGSDEKFTELWTLKEAALKLLGLGLSVDAREAEIKAGGPEFSGRALARYEELGRPVIKWKSLRKDDRIVSVVWA